MTRKSMAKQGIERHGAQNKAHKKLDQQVRALGKATKEKH